MIKNSQDQLECISKLYNYLQGKIEFNSDGMPLLTQEHFTQQVPQQLIPFDHRNNKIYRDIQKVYSTLCFYASDASNYRRLEHVLNNLFIYKEYGAVVSLDITVTSDMDLEWQKVQLASNALFMACLAVNGIPIIPNIRIGSRETLPLLSHIPKNSIVSCSFLGCDNIKNQLDVDFLFKILYLQPKHLLIYDKRDALAEEQLNRFAIPYTRYDDFHRLCRMQAAAQVNESQSAGPASIIA